MGSAATAAVWVLELLDAAEAGVRLQGNPSMPATNGAKTSPQSTLWKLTQVGSDHAIYCEQADNSPVIFCEEGLEGDFVLSTHTSRFIHSHLATDATGRDSVTVGKCSPQEG